MTKLDLPVLNFKPTKMYVFNGDDDPSEMFVLGIWNNYYLAVSIDTIVTLKTEFKVTPYRFAVLKTEVVKQAKANSIN